MAASKGLVGLLKRGWNEIPEVVATTGAAFLAILVTAPVLYKREVIDGGEKQPHRIRYTDFLRSNTSPRPEEVCRRDGRKFRQMMRPNDPKWKEVKDPRTSADDM